MPRRRFLAWIVLAVASTATMPAGATNAGGASEVVVALLDTGIRATHQEFDYQGAASMTDQVVAWWDFTEQKGAYNLPSLGQMWDTRTPDPYDGNGHGTRTASMAVGRNMSAAKSRAYAPGFKLAVAKVGQDDGTIDGDLAKAIRWAVDTVHADVINISIGSIVPFPAGLDFDGTYSALRYARQRGVLVVVANGNGYGNAGLVTADPSWANSYSSSLDVLSVGANGANAFLVSTDPEVTAIYSPTSARNNADNTYNAAGGTSFASPTVAGMAAKAMEVALANGRSATPDYIETLLKYSANDNPVYAPSFDGYGELNAARFDGVVLVHAAAGTLPSRPSPDLAAAYVEDTVAPLRELWSRKLNRSFTPLDRDPGTAPGVIGTSVPAVLEGETYTITLAAGETATVTMKYVAPNDVDDVDVTVFAAGRLDGSYREGRSAQGAAVDESVTISSVWGGTYTVLIAGWSIATEAAIIVSSTSSDVSTAEIAFVGQDTYFETDGLGIGG